MRELLKNTSQRILKLMKVIYPSLRIIEVSLGILTQKPWTTIYCQKAINFGIHMEVYVRT